MRHWVYALVLGILLGVGLGVGGTLLWHGESKQATPPALMPPALIVLLVQENGSQFGDGLSA